MRPLTLSLTSLAHSGDALGRLPDGRACFVPGGLPGEVVRVRLTESKKRFARGEILEIITPSEERILPRCAHFGECGGCQYQHMPYQSQLRAKTAQLRQTLRKLAGLDDPPIRPIVPSPTPWHYRNHIQFHLTPQGRLGFHAPRSPTVIPIHECHLPAPPLDEIWPHLDIDPIPGLERIGLRTNTRGDVQLTLEGSHPNPPEFTVDFPLSAVYLGPGDPIVLSGSQHLFIEVLGRAFRLSAGAFFQTNTPLAEKMVAHILQHLPPALGTVLDLYCGGGLFSAFLVPRAQNLIGIEADPHACDDFVFNLDEFENVELYQAPVEHTLPRLDAHPDLILADPPRTGLGRRTLDALLSLASPLLIYVSCDPGALARDAKTLLTSGYTLSHITPFDLFPQTYHLETISFWQRQA